MMCSANNNNINNSNSIRSALFDAAIQLSAPSVTSTASAATKIRTHSIPEESTLLSSCPSSSNNSRSSFSSGSNHTSRRSNAVKPKLVRDVATQSLPIIRVDNNTKSRPNRLNLIVDNNNNPTTKSSISETSKEYLLVPQQNRCQLSPNTSPTRNGRSLKTALLGIWQGLNSDELRSAAVSPIDPKFFDERVGIVTE